MKKTTFEDIKFNKNNKIIINDNLNKLSFDDHLLVNNEINKHNNKYIHIYLWVVFIIVLVIYISNNLLHRVNINLKTKEVVIDYIDEKFSGFKSNGISDNIINFDIMNSDPYIKTNNMFLTQVENLSKQSHGIIRMYNTENTSPQKLLVNTFIEDKNGRSYKIDSTIIIPGYKIVDNKIIPGQIDVNIKSFLPGLIYNNNNIGEVFYINSFKGTSKYKKIYGELIHELSGGISGTVYTPNENELMKLNDIANSTFRSNLVKNIKAYVSDEYILYDGALLFSYKINDEIYSNTPETKINIEGYAQAVILNKKTLINYIIKKEFNNISENEINEIEVIGIDNLVFKWDIPNQVIDKDLKNISFSLSGTLHFKWNPDLNNLKNKLVEYDKKNILKVFEDDPGILSANIKIFPPWKKYLPKKINKIYIKEIKNID